MDPVLQTQGKDISTRLWHASLAFSPPSGLWHASACYFTNTSSLFSAIQIHILHLQSCGYFGPMKATCGQTNNQGLRCVCVCLSVSVCKCVYKQQVWMEHTVCWHQVWGTFPSYGVVMARLRAFTATEYFGLAVGHLNISFQISECHEHKD